MPYRAVIFDLDGTLADTIDDLADATNWMLEQFGLPTHPVADYRVFVGEGAETLCRRALGPDNEHLVAKAMPMMRARYSEHMFDKTRPYDGIPELLDGLTERNLPMAVLSNKPHDGVAAIVQRLLGRWNWAVVRGVGPDGIHKPDPRHALAIAEQLDVPPAEVLYLGDTNIDMWTATAAGMLAVGVLWGFRDEAELRETGADHIVAHPAEVIELL